MNSGGMGATRLGSDQGQAIVNSDLIPSAALVEWEGVPLTSAQRSELQSLTQEPDPRLYSQGLLNFAARQESAGSLDVALAVYQRVATGSSAQDPSALLAQQRLDAIRGQGTFGNRAEFLLQNLAKEAAEPSALLAMGAASAAFRLTRLAVFSRLAGAAESGILTRALGAGRLASFAGFAVEAPAYTLTGRLANEALGRRQAWDLRSFGKDLASSYLVLGAMKLAGTASAALNAGQSPGLRGVLQQGAMLSGILLGHRLEAWAGLREWRGDANTLMDSLALLLQFHVAGKLTQGAFGPRFAAWEAGLDLQHQILQEAAPRFPQGGIQTPQTFAVAMGGPPVEPESLSGPHLILMEGGSRDGDRSPVSPLVAQLIEHRSSNPPPDQGVLGKDAIQWGARYQRNADAVQTVLRFAAKLRMAMWNELNLRIDGQVARALAQRSSIEVCVRPLDGSLENYSVELSTDIRTPQNSPDEVRFVFNPAEGSLRLKDYLPNARWEKERLQAGGVALQGFIPFFRSIVGFRSEGLKAQPLIDTLPPAAREYVLMEPTHFPAPRDQPISRIQASGNSQAKAARQTLTESGNTQGSSNISPSLLVQYFPRIVAGVREAADRFLDERMIQGTKERDRLHRLMQHMLTLLRSREEENPDFYKNPFLQVWIRPSPEGRGKRSVEILTPGEALEKFQGGPGPEDIMLSLVRAPSGLSGGIPILEHQYLRPNPKNPLLPTGADLAFQRSLGLGDHLKLSLQVDDLGWYPPDIDTWDAWMQEHAPAEPFAAPRDIKP